MPPHAHDLLLTHSLSHPPPPRIADPGVYDLVARWEEESIAGAVGEVMATAAMMTEWQQAAGVWGDAQTELIPDDEVEDKSG